MKIDFKTENRLFEPSPILYVEMHKNLVYIDFNRTFSTEGKKQDCVAARVLFQPPAESYWVQSPVSTA